MTPVAAETPHVVAAVVGSDAVAVDAVRALLDDAPVTVVEPASLVADAHRDPHGRALVLVRPDESTWRVVAAAAVPALVVVDEEPDGAALLELAERGVLGVIAPEDSADDFLTAVRTVADGHAALGPGRVQRLLAALRAGRASAAPVALTKRELDVLRAIDAGASVKQTARTLGISPRTVDNVQRFLFRKLGVRNRVQAIATAHALGLIGPGATHEGAS
jgi:DNA-binding NarL/FixJ family response regulator